MPPEPISSSIRYLPLSFVPITVVMVCLPLLCAAMVPVAYHTDPACPWSWGLEPSVRKLMVEFGSGLDWTFVMGGLGRSLAREPASRAAMIVEWLRVTAETQ